MLVRVSRACASRLPPRLPSSSVIQASARFNMVMVGMRRCSVQLAAQLHSRALQAPHMAANSCFTCGTCINAQPSHQLRENLWRSASLWPRFAPAARLHRRLRPALGPVGAQRLGGPTAPAVRSARSVRRLLGHRL